MLSRMREDARVPAAILGLAVALGLALAGWFVGDALRDVKASQRHVTVKGLSEREVRANLAMWPIVFRVTGNDLASLQASLDASTRTVASFLEAQGFAREEWSTSSPRVTDYESQPEGVRRPAYRYAAESVVTLRSGKVDEVKKAIEKSADLIKAGVAMVRSYEYNTTFLYTELEKIKPEMIAEATKDARRAAEQFAMDSGSALGPIRTAQQGYFSIEDRDAFSPEFKKVRVVTTLEYLLAD
jgi:hypothetical protein